MFLSSIGTLAERCRPVSAIRGGANSIAGQLRLPSCSGDLRPLVNLDQNKLDQGRWCYFTHYPHQVYVVITKYL